MLVTVCVPFEKQLKLPLLKKKNIVLGQFTFGLSDKDKTFQFAPTILNKFFFILDSSSAPICFFLCVINVIVSGDLNQGYVDSNLLWYKWNYYSLDPTEKNI